METNFSDRANFTTRLSSFLYDKIKKWSRRTKEERGMEEEEKRETKEKKKRRRKKREIEEEEILKRHRYS